MHDMSPEGHTAVVGAIVDFAWACAVWDTAAAITSVKKHEVRKRVEAERKNLEVISSSAQRRNSFLFKRYRDRASSLRQQS
jgi:hypothetical protein